MSPTSDRDVRAALRGLVLPDAPPALRSRLAAEVALARPRRRVWRWGWVQAAIVVGLVVTLTATVQRWTSSPASGDSPPVAATVADGPFTLTFTSAHGTYRPDQILEARATITYAGPESSITVRHDVAGPIMFGIVEPIYGAMIEPILDLTCTQTTLERGKPLSIPFKKTGASTSTADPAAIATLFDGPDLRLPAGAWHLYAEVDFDRTDCGGTRAETKLSAEVPIVVGDASSPTATPTALGTFVPVPVTPFVSPVPTASTAAGFPTLSQDGGVDQAGTFGLRGLWGVRGESLFISTDAGTSWKRTTFPASTAYGGSQITTAIDATHIWTVTLGPGTTEQTGSTADVLRYVVNRTTDGGLTWDAAVLPGNFAEAGASIAFSDADNGYLVASPNRNSFGISTAVRTRDGGATWQVTGHSPWLGPLVAVSDASTVWAGGEEQAGGQFLQPVLAVSRDGGVTWDSVRLATIAGTTEAECGCYLAEPPVFLDSMTGYVTVVSSFGNGPTYTRIERTSDGGHTWTVATDRPDILARAVAILDVSHWLMVADDPATPYSTAVYETVDGGATWAVVSSGDAWTTSAPAWMNAISPSGAVGMFPLGHSDVTPNHALAFTTDGGRTWAQLPVEDRSASPEPTQ